jgi:hypothetical protein
MRSLRSRCLVGCLAAGLLCGLLGAPTATCASERPSPPTCGTPAWVISNDPADPLANTASPANGPTTLYLWAYVMEGPPGGSLGLAWAELALVTSGNLSVDSIQSMNGFSVSGNADSLYIEVGGCPSGPVSAAILHCTDFGGQICFGAPPSGLNCSALCLGGGDPVLWHNAYIGFASDGGQPCYDDPIWVPCGPPVSVENTLWGTVKSLYR